MPVGYIYIMGAGLAWSFLGIYIKLLAAVGFESMQIVSLRATLAAVILTALLAFWRGTALFRIKLRDWWLFAGMAIFSILISNGCSFAAMQESGITVAIILLYTSPVFVTVMAAIFFGEPLTGQKVAALLLALLGCAFVSGAGQDTGGNVSLLGVGLGLASAFGYALYSIFGRIALNRGYKPLTLVLYTFIIAGSMSWLFADIKQAVLLVRDLRTLLLVLGLSVLSTILPYFLYGKGLETVEASKASILACVEPAMAIVFGVMIFSEPFTISIAIGILAIFGAVMLLNSKKA